MKTRRNFSFCVSRRRGGSLSTSVRVVSLKQDPNKFKPKNKLLDKTLCRVRCYPRDVRIARLIAQQIAIRLNQHKLYPSQLKGLDIRTPEELKRVYELYLGKPKATEGKQHEKVEENNTGT